MAARAALMSRCASRNLDEAPSLADHCEVCCSAMGSVFPLAKVSVTATRSSREFLVIVGDSTLKTNRGRSGSRLLSAKEVQSALVVEQQQQNILVACWPGCSLRDLSDIADAIAGVADVSRLVVVWQGNEYTTLAGKDVSSYVATLFAMLQASADSVNFVLPAPDSVWRYGDSYDAFAEEVRRVALREFRAEADVDLSGAFELGGMRLVRSHLSSAHHEDLATIVANWA
jgi:hypothetical protein